MRLIGVFAAGYPAGEEISVLLPPVVVATAAAMLAARRTTPTPATT